MHKWKSNGLDGRLHKRNSWGNETFILPCNLFGCAVAFASVFYICSNLLVQCSSFKGRVPIKFKEVKGMFLEKIKNEREFLYR